MNSTDDSAHMGDASDEESSGVVDTALPESAELYRQAVALSGQIPFAADRQGHILSGGSGWTALTGMPLAEALGDGWLKAVHPDDRHRLIKTRRAGYSTGEPYECEYRLRLIDGSYRWFRTRAGAQCDETGQVIRWYGTIEDIHDQKLAEQALRESEEHYRYSVELNPQIPWVANAEGQTIEISPRWLALTGLSREEYFSPEGWSKALHPDDVLSAARKWSRSVETGEPYDDEFRLRLADGSYRWFRGRAAPRRDENGRIIRWYGTDEDIHDRKLAEERLHWAAYHDYLTGLPNRRRFHERLRQALDRADRTKRRVGLLIIDIDDFKAINDRFGHDVGDALLRAFGQQLRRVVRPIDTVARLGGDEFALILPDVEGEAEVAAMARAIQARMQEPLRLNNGTQNCRTSIGGTVAAGYRMKPDELLKQADLALSHCKAARGDRFRMFEPAMRDAAQRAASALEIARKALAEGWIVPFYQPKVVLSSSQLVGFEALLRWRHPRLGLQGPETIAPAFDDTEVGVAIGEHMLACVIHDMRRWLDIGLDFGRVAINASAAEFRRGDYAERVLECLFQGRVPPSRLEVEITETVFLDRNAENVERILRLLSAAGVTIALDDFGTGYASLSHLKRFPVDVIKIDRSFVHDMETDADDAAIVNAVLNLGQNLGIEVVAEGVENATQVSLLQKYGCDLAQGYHVGRPMPAGEIPQVITSWARNAGWRIEDNR